MTVLVREVMERDFYDDTVCKGGSRSERRETRMSVSRNATGDAQG